MHAFEDNNVFTASELNEGGKISRKVQALPEMKISNS